MITALSRLEPGSHFRLHGMPHVTGILLECGDCSAHVKLDGRLIVVECGQGRRKRQFVADTGRHDHWAPATVVEFLWRDEPCTHS
jgi:hypothetical protein